MLDCCLVTLTHGESESCIKHAVNVVFAQHEKEQCGLLKGISIATEQRYIERKELLPSDAIVLADLLVVIRI